MSVSPSYREPAVGIEPTTAPQQELDFAPRPSVGALNRPAGVLPFPRTRPETPTDRATERQRAVPAERREAAQQSALGKLPVGVREALEGAVRALPVGAVFTAESLRGELSFAVRDVLNARTENGRTMRYANGLGALFANLAKRGEIEPAGYCEAQRDAARGRVIRRWRRTGRAA